MEWKVCPKCNNRNAAASKYCDQCGHTLDDENTTALAWQFASATDVGLVRQQNEDAMYAKVLNPSVGLFLVADGMGGAAAGEVASHLAIETVSQEFLREIDTATAELDWRVIINKAFESANREIYTARRAAGNDMGTTLVGALLVGTHAIIANIGDSRAYHVNRQTIRPISKDHSIVQMLVDSGQIQPDEVRIHPQRNLILRCLGEQREIETDLFDVEMSPDEWLLLCSDGLWEMVLDAEIHGIITNAPTLDEACQALIQSAKEHGGHDNITVVLIQPT